MSGQLYSGIDACCGEPECIKAVEEFKRTGREILGFEQCRICMAFPWRGCEACLPPVDGDEDGEWTHARSERGSNKHARRARLDRSS